MIYELSLKHIERQWQWQRQRPMLVNGDAWEWVWDQFSSITIDQHWPLPLPLLLTLSLVIHLYTGSEPLIVRRSFIRITSNSFSLPYVTKMDSFLNYTNLDL